jgi:4a-hydroxytetrahydrobiopterin dehydratase
MSTPLTPEQIKDHLNSLTGWESREGKLIRHYRFKDFPAAMAGIMQMAFACEAANHHPEIYQVYNRLDIALTTHDAGNQITQKDVDLARQIEAIIGSASLG